MNLQIIKARDGSPEYVLLPISIYRNLRNEIEVELSKSEEDYVPFNAADYVDNPIALARIKAHITQQELAELMGVSQAYISKIENQTKVSQKLLARVVNLISTIKR